jgi:hypothetical protein
MVIMGLIGSVVNAPVTTFISGLLKKIRLFDSVPARTLSFVVAGVLVVVTWIATYFGFKVQLNSFLNAILVAGPVVMQFVLTLLGSHATYAYARDRKISIVGYQRTAPPDYKVPTVRTPTERGQGLVEYALILVLVAVVVIVISGPARSGDWQHLFQLGAQLGMQRRSLPTPVS